MKFANINCGLWNENFKLNCSGDFCEDDIVKCGCYTTEKTIKDEYKAEYRAAWANDIVYMCEKHFKHLMAVGNAMGFPVKGERCEPGRVCKNCENENKQEQ